MNGKPKQKLRESKKAIILGIALLNINIFIFLGVWLKIPNEIIVQGITAVLFLVGIYTGVQGGVDMIQSNKFEASTQTVNQHTTEEYIERIPRPKDYDDEILP